MSKPIKDLFSEKNIFPDLKAADRDGVLADLAERIASLHKPLKGEAVYRALLDREKAGSTAIGHGVSFPHIRLEECKEIILALGRSKEGIGFHSLDGKPTHLFLVLIAPPEGDYLKILAKFSKAFQNPEFCRNMIAADDAAAIFKILSAAV